MLSLICMDFIKYAEIKIQSILEINTFLRAINIISTLSKDEKKTLNKLINKQITINANL
jgi:hypothetical protein